MEFYNKTVTLLTNSFVKNKAELVIQYSDKGFQPQEETKGGPTPYN